MDVLGETREVLRNDALIVLFKLTKGNSNIQKIVAFENAFDKLMEIMEFEGWTDGGIVVEDCLRLLLNLLRNNPSNQTFFKEGSYINRLLAALDITSTETAEYGWDAQKVSNMLHILQLIRTLVAPSNPAQGRKFLGIKNIMLFHFYFIFPTIISYGSKLHLLRN